MTERPLKSAHRHPNPLVRKLAHFAPLSAEDVRTLDELGRSDEHFDADQDIVAQGATPRSVFVLIEGMACRYRVLANGRRQIMTFLLPGDLCDLHVFLSRKMDHSIGTLTQARLAAITRADVLKLAMCCPRVTAALWWSTMQEEAMLRERIVALGRRNARGRVAYLVCELVWRQKAIGASDGDAISLPLSQAELADTLGLTPVHINRVLQDLRRDKLLDFRQRTLVLRDINKLAAIAGFDSSYLQFGGAPEEMRRYFDQVERERA